MGPYLVLCCLFFSQLFAAFPTSVSAPVLYNTHRREFSKAVDTYIAHVRESGEHDFDLLRRMGMEILEQGSRHGSAEDQIMCLFGAGVALSTKLIPILERGLRNEDMKAQLVALNFLGRIGDDEAEEVLVDALSSPFLLTRLEACMQLAKRGHPELLGHLQVLYAKVPPVIHPIFPQIAVLLDTSEANKLIGQLLSDKDFVVRTETILGIAHKKRDEFLPHIRKLASQAHFAVQEAAAFALGELHDRSSIEMLTKLSESRQDSVQLAAAVALQKLGEPQGVEVLLACAEEGNLFAMRALAQIKQKRVIELLEKQLYARDRDVRLNAALSLLEAREKSALPVLSKLLFYEQKDLGFAEMSTPAGALKAWKALPSLSARDARLQGQSRAMQTQVLLLMLEISEETFYEVARHIFDEKMTPLIPQVIELLANHRTEHSLHLLKEMQQKAGAPFIRNSCNLALFQLGEEGAYKENLIRWINSMQQEFMIRFQEPKQQKMTTTYTLTPEESSQLLIKSYETLAQSSDEEGLLTLLKAIGYGNPQNRYALAGLLIRTCE